jgi:hypothetical protein
MQFVKGFLVGTSFVIFWSFALIAIRMWMAWRVYRPGPFSLDIINILHSPLSLFGAVASFTLGFVWEYGRAAQ